MVARVSDGPEVENAPQRKMQRIENRAPNADEEFPIHEDAKSTGNNVPSNDHDLRYARLLEAMTKIALAIREEISRASLVTSAASDRIENQVGKLTADFEKLQVAFKQGIQFRNDRIGKREVKFEDFKLQMQHELEQIESKQFAVAGLGRVASAPCLAHPSKNNDPTFFDPSIVRLNSQSIVGRDKVWEVAAKLLAAANISEAEVELLPQIPMVRGYRFKFTTPGPTAATQTKQLVE